MSDTTTDQTTDTPEVAVDDTTEPSTVDTENVETPDTEPQSKREARYRTQLRETEAERDALTQRLEALQRSEVERLAAAKVDKPQAIWAAGTDLADLLDDAGNIDPDKVTEAAEKARTELGLAKPWAAPIVPLEGTGTHRGTARDPWKSAFTS